MAYACIDPRMWDDDKFVALDDSARLLWVYLITGPEALSGPPGLIVIGTGGLAEALRRSTQDIACALDRLRQVGMVVIDPLHRLIRVPKAPFYRAPGNVNVVRGWYRRWTSLPNSQLKYDQLESMRDALAEVDVAGSTREVFEQTFGRDLARRVAFRTGQTAGVVVHQGGQSNQPTEPMQTSLPLGAAVALVRPVEVCEEFSTDFAVSVDSGKNLEEISGLACPVSSQVESFGNHSPMVPEWSIPERIPEPLRRSSSGSEPSRDLYPPTQVAEPEPEVDPVPRMALALRTWRLERVLALQAAGIGATLPAPSIHDEVAKGEPDRLVRSWLAAARRTGVDPEVLVRQRSMQLLDALEASAKRDRSIAGMRETVCYSPKVVDWALTTEAASVATRPTATTGRPAMAVAPRPSPGPTPVVVPAEERAAAAAMLRATMAQGRISSGGAA